MHFWEEIKSMSFKNIFRFKSKIMKIDIANAIKKFVYTGAMVDTF